MWYQQCGVCMTIFPMLQKKKLGRWIVDMNNLPKVTQLIGGLSGVRTRDLIQDAWSPMPPATDSGTWDVQKTFISELLSLSWAGLLAPVCCKDICIWFQSISSFNLLPDILHPSSNVWGFCLCIQSNSLTPVGCPTIQVNSDTVYLEVAPDSTG